MSYLHYHSSRSRERDYDDDPFYSRPLVRTNSKRQRIYDDDEYDDYPYSSSHRSKPSRALTIRQPSQIEKYNVWSYPKSPSKERDHSDHEDDHKIRYKYYTTTSRPSYSYSRSDDEDERDRDVSVKVKTYSSRPKSSHSSHKAFVWPAEVFRRKEKWEREDWETKERDRGDSFWGDEPRLKEREIRYRRIKRTKTDEWKPLKGWRRS